MNTYQLTISEKQAGMIAVALDVYDRMLAGQASMALSILWPSMDYDARRALEREINALAGGAQHHKTGAFNLRKTIEAAVSWTHNPEGGMSVNYDGPMGGWWDGEPPAVCLRWEGEEAVRVRDRANQTQRLGARLEDLIGTGDIEEATRIVAEWKRKAEAAV